MKRFPQYTLLLLFILAFTAVSAQQKEITLEDIWGGTFRTERLDALRSLKNGKEYAILNYNRQQSNSTIDVYNYKSGDKVRTLLSTADLPGINYIISYELSEDETKLLIATQLKQIYRRSSLGTFYVYDLKSKQLTLVSDKQIQEPTFNNNASKVAFGYNNNLYIKDLASGAEIQVTTDGKKNSIINGITDWVYEEEFAFVRAFDWSADGTKLAYIRFDETKVPRFSMDVFGEDLYPSQQVFKYPKAGDPNADVSLHLYDVSTQQTNNIDLSSFTSYYIPRLQWTKDPDVLSVQLTNRKQNVVDLVFVNAKTNTASLVLKEKDNAYVDITDNLTFLNDNSFIWTSEKDGWNHIYLYDKTGKLINQITKGDWEVTNYYGFDQKTGRVYYQSTENGSINRDVYSILKSGENKVRLSNKTGTNSAAFSADFTYYINTFHDTQTPYIFTLNDALKGEQIREIKNNNELKIPLVTFCNPPLDFSIHYYS